MNRQRVAGWSALGFAVSIIAINLIENMGTSRPDPAASPEEVAAWAINGDLYLWSTTLLVPISWVLLIVVAASVWTWARSAGIDLLSPTVGVLGSAMTMGTLSAAIATDAALITSVEGMSLDLVELATGFTTVLFIVNWAALALALYGLSRATTALGLTPKWLDRLTLAGAFLLVIGSTQSGPVLHGFLPGVLLGFAGFVVWLTYLAVLGVQLLRTSGPTSRSTLVPAQGQVN